ncbi:MAG: EF-P beta-lysylation protein EpmB [Immundisolibacteraceae bacterium]|nr:EF-P beta-lysylation protein EpmB [Immundisolibacteraceae bacterium]
MVTRSDLIDTPHTWQQQVADAITDLDELFSLLNLPAQLLPAAKTATQQFPLRFPRQLIKQIKPGDINDPLLRQFLPAAAELLTSPGYETDPLAEADAQVAPGLLHKYPGRVLLVTTAACAVHCRYCFRRHFPYKEQAGEQDNWQAALEYIAADPAIHEVILSGGDPLSLSDRRLAMLVDKLEQIPHLHTLRFHSRTAALYPDRVNDDFTLLLRNTRLQVVMVTHINHPKELTESTQAAMSRLKDADVLLLNQSVLLAGVNDQVSTLRQLSHGLFSNHILPYYLHLPDAVEGTTDFAVSQAVGEQL